MATVQTLNNNQDDQQSITGAPPQTGGAAAAPSTGSSSAAPTVAAPKGSSSGRFTNLNAYLNANKGYKQDQGGLAGQITNNLGNQANKIQNNFDQSNKQFQTDANGNRIQYNGDLVNNAINNSSQFVGDANNVDAFSKLRDATYNGPTNLANAGQLQNQAQGLQSTANLSQTEGGRYALLNKLYGNATYNKGQQSLDNLLLQGNSQQLQKLNTVNPMASQLNSTVSNGIQSAQDLAGQYKNEAQATQDQTRNALTGAVTGFDNKAQSAVAAANAGRDKAYQDALTNFSQGKMSAEDLNKFGVGNNTALYDVNKNDPNKYFTESNFTATKQNVLNPEQMAQIQALQKLSGNALSGDVTGQLATYNDPSQAGQFAAHSPYSFDTNKFTQDVGAQKSAYDTQSAAINKQIAQQQALMNQQQANSGRNTTVTQNGQTMSGSDQIRQVIAKLQAQQQALNNQYGIGGALNGGATSFQASNPLTRKI